jgi:GAF domain
MDTEAALQHLSESLSQISECTHEIDTNAAMLGTLARYFGAKWATFWKVDSHARTLRTSTTWCEEPALFKSLLRDAATRVLALREGAAGHVWHSGNPISTSDLIRDMCLPRSLYANHAGCTSGIWFPIRANATTYGVIELLGKRSWPNNQQFLDLLAALGDLIGKSLPPCRKD